MLLHRTHVFVSLRQPYMASIAGTLWSQRTCRPTSETTPQQLTKQAIIACLGAYDHEGLTAYSVTAYGDNKMFVTSCRLVIWRCRGQAATRRVHKVRSVSPQRPNVYVVATCDPTIAQHLSVASCLTNFWLFTNTISIPGIDTFFSPYSTCGVRGRHGPTSPTALQMYHTRSNSTQPIGVNLQVGPKACMLSSRFAAG